MATSRLKPILPREGLLIYQYPHVLKEFVVGCVRNLSIDDRAALRHLCLDYVAGSKLDVNLSSDHDIYKLFEFLVQDNKLSFADYVSVLKRILSVIGQKDLLQSLKQVKLRIYIGNIVEGYVKMKGCACENGGLSEGPCCYDGSVELLVAIKTRNKGLIEEFLNQLSMVVVDGNFLRICNGIIRSHLSWSALVVYLVIIGELYGSYSRSSGTSVDVASDGYYAYAFSGTKTSQLLSEWILENGGLKTFKKFVWSQRGVLDNGSDVPESLREIRRLLQCYFET